MPFIAGIDCSGTPDLGLSDRKHDPYVVCMAIIEVPEDVPSCLLDKFSDIRRHLAHRSEQAARTWGSEREFHGHQMREEEILTFLTGITEMQVRLGALIIEKGGAIENGDNPLPSSRYVYEKSVAAVVKLCCEEQYLAKLHFDQDISSKEVQRAIITSAKRIHRQFHPGRTLSARFVSSEDSEAVQVADVAAYAFAHYIRGTIQQKTLQDFVGTMVRQNAPHIIGPQTWSAMGM